MFKFISDLSHLHPILFLVVFILIAIILIWNLLLKEQAILSYFDAQKKLIYTLVILVVSFILTAILFWMFIDVIKIQEHIRFVDPK